MTECASIAGSFSATIGGCGLPNVLDCAEPGATADKTAAAPAPKPTNALRLNAGEVDAVGSSKSLMADGSSLRKVVLQRSAAPLTDLIIRLHSAIPLALCRTSPKKRSAVWIKRGSRALCQIGGCNVRSRMNSKLCKDAFDMRLNRPDTDRKTGRDGTVRGAFGR